MQDKRGDYALNRNRKKTFLTIVAVLTTAVVCLAIVLYINYKMSLPSFADASKAIQDEFTELIGYNRDNPTPVMSALYDGFNVTVYSVSKSEEKNKFIAGEKSQLCMRMIRVLICLICSITMDM